MGLLHLLGNKMKSKKQTNLSRCHSVQSLGLLPGDLVECRKNGKTFLLFLARYRLGDYHDFSSNIKRKVRYATFLNLTENREVRYRVAQRIVYHNIIRGAADI